MSAWGLLMLLMLLPSGLAPPMERRGVDAQDVGGARLVAVAAFEHVVDVLLLELAQGRQGLEGAEGRGRALGRYGQGPAHRRTIDGLLVRGDDEPLDQMLELAHVPRPA